MRVSGAVTGRCHLSRSEHSWPAAAGMWGRGQGALSRPHRRGSGNGHAWPGQRAAREGRKRVGSCAGGSPHRAQTFIHGEETLAQDVAAAPELHPEPAVRGDEGPRGFVATKPAWEVEETVRLPAREGALQTESGAPDGARRSGAPPRPGARPGLSDGGNGHPACVPSSDRQEDRQSLPMPRAQPKSSLLQTRPARRVLKVWRDNGLRQGRLWPPWCLPGPSLLGMPVGRHSAFSASEKGCQRSRDEESKASWLWNVTAQSPHQRFRRKHNE